MILDVHTHIWSSLEQFGPEIAESLRTRAAERGMTIEASPLSHERSMSCVDAALVFGFRSERLAAHVPNELIAEFVARDPRKRIGICGIDPLSGDALDQIESGHAMGLAGATVSPACQGF